MNQDEHARLTAERDEARRQLAKMRVHAPGSLGESAQWLLNTWTEPAFVRGPRQDVAIRCARGVLALTAERDRLRDALRRARLDVTDVGTSGWDSTRLERTKEAVARIDAALAESEETT